MKNKRLLTLTLGGLSIGTTEFVMMGLLPYVAKEFHVSIPQAGHFIAAYALGVVIGAPLLVIIGGNYPPKKMLMWLMGIFVLFNGLTALSTGPNMMIFTRMMSGLPHGAFFGVGSVVAARLASKGKEAASISIMFAGLTLANILMVPFGTYLGEHFSWRYAFALVAFFGLLTLVSIAIWLPALPVERKGNLKAELGFFKQRIAWVMILITAIGTGGLFAWISYISPMMTEVTHFSKDFVPFILVIAGFGMFVGNFIGGKLADKMPPAKALIMVLFTVGVTLSLDYLVAANQVLTLITTFLTGASTFALAAPIQILMIRTAKNAEMLGASATQAAFNMGNAIGAFAGGLPIAAGFGYTSPILVGIVMVMIGIILTIVLISMQRQPEPSIATCGS